MEQIPLFTHIKVEPLEPAQSTAGSEHDHVNVEPTEPAEVEETPEGGDPLHTEIKREPLEIEADPIEPPPQPMVNIPPGQVIKVGKPKRAPRRVPLACEDCGTVCSSAGFLRRHKQHCKPKNADGMFTCELCPAAFKLAIRLKYHMNAHKGIKNFQCRIEGCEKAFSNPESRYTHEEDCRDTGPSTCAVCGATFQFSRNLRTHMKLHEAPRFECQICNKKFSQRKSLREHWFTHFKDKAGAALVGEKYLANFEDKVGDGSDEEEPTEKLGVSEQSQNDPAKVHFCDLCGKSFPVEEYLKRHADFCTGFIPVKIDSTTAETSVENSAILDCLVCGKRAESVEALKTHMVQHEKGRFKCDICQRDFGSKIILRRHALVHSDERNHLCDVCGKGFKSERAKAKHTKYMHTAPQKLSCELCNETYTNVYRYRYHMNKHTGQLPFKCRNEGCGQGFPQPDVRHRHEQYCGKEPVDIECTVCGAKFKAKKYLTVHMAAHNPKFECELCGKKFGENSRLQNHMKQKHQKEAETDVESEEMDSEEESEAEGVGEVKQEPND